MSSRYTNEERERKRVRFAGVMRLEGTSIPAACRAAGMSPSTFYAWNSGNSWKRKRGWDRDDMPTRDDMWTRSARTRHVARTTRRPRRRQTVAMKRPS
jgi:hypothetical protein